jgi:hypothetical protein
MWILFLLAATFAAAPASGGELCFDDGRYWCCQWPQPCDVVVPMPWIGFRTDSAACADSMPWASAAVSLSASSTNPFVNSGPVPSDGRLYLWNVGWALVSAGASYGWGAFMIYVDGDLPIQAYEPIAPADANIWLPWTGLISFDACYTDDPPPTIIGAFVISTVGVEGRTWGSMKALYR